MPLVLQISLSLLPIQNKSRRLNSPDVAVYTLHSSRCSGNPLSTDMQGSADQHMDVDQGSNYQQAPHSSSSVDHQMMQNSQVLHDQNLAASRAEGQDSGSSLDERKHQDIPKVQNNKSQTEKDICRDGVESRTQSQPPAPEDIATFKIKVISPTPFPAKWRCKLEKALQSWFIKLEKKREKRASVLSLTLMNDGCAEVEVTPSTALEALKKHMALSLNIKTENAQIPAILKDDESPRAVVLHAGVNDTTLRQTETLKRDFRSLIETVRSTTPAATIVVSGPLPTYRRGHERFSRLFALNEWLLSWCKEQKLLFVNNWNLFWERPRLFRADGLHPSRVGAELLSDNISRTLRSM
ncbi:uncharacterized protein LOC127968191 isoform X3 [Carassius gibelio]|uniref:uncharacterized protein LOC127968191 isoform X3 n=1 Tax=Carassius gibelio TaxID=101364 RepID=UPI0022796BD8|nr:uncharacterized protein LOC127968191 isoform X3 [Carassius gibelio]